MDAPTSTIAGGCRIPASALAGQMGWSRTMATGQQQFAQPPVNVRIEHNDGTYTAVECVYAGVKNGKHHWNTIREVILKHGDKKVWDEMPPLTEVHLYIREARS